MARKKPTRAEIKKRIKADPEGEQRRAQERLRALAAEIEELERLFVVLGKATSKEKVAVAADEISGYLSCASSDCRLAVEQIDSLGEAEAATLLSVLSEKIDIDYENEII